MRLYRINALLLKYYYITLNRVDRLFDIFYWPMIDIIVWGFASAFIEDISSYNLLSMLMGGIILWMFVWRASQDIAVFVLEDFWSKNLYNLFSSPVRVSEHLLSIILFGFLRGLASFIVMSLLAFLLYSFNILTIPLGYIVISIFLLSLFGWSLGLFVTAFIFRFGQRIQVLAWSVAWIIQPFSCIFYPLSSLPSWAVPIARLLPTTHVFETLRAVLFDGSINPAGLWYAFIADIILLLAMAFFMKSSFERARVTGMLAKGE